MDNNLKITLLLRYFNIGGLERVVSSLANSYVKRGIDTEIVVMFSGRNNSLITELDPRVKIRILNGSLISKLFELNRITKNRLVHIHFGNGMIFPILRLPVANRKKVITYHSNYSHKRNWFKNRIDQFYASRVDGIIAVSESVKDFVVSDVHIKSDKVEVIHNGVDYDLSDSVGSKGDQIELISLSNLFPHKNQKVIIDALSICKKRGLDIKLKMMGDGPKMAELYQLCVNQGLGNNIKWYGAIWYKDYVHNLLSTSDGFISASKFEGFPISILEGMAYKLPLILSDIPPHKELAGESALYFSNENANDLADKLEMFAKDQLLRLKLRNMSAEKYTNYTLDLCVFKHIEVYKKVLKGDVHSKSIQHKGSAT